ncbi:MAG: sulfite exporter TauE/SafE family protein [Gammaproteobacteria bacterium]|nr:sulfite exporter TauE/SafE family protein [Gammaproteobacteria bacterium]
MIELTVYTAALVAGLFGSGHCTAMCGGIAGAICCHGANNRSHILVYNLGRILSYTVAGFLAGALGNFLSSAFEWQLLSVNARIATGLVMVLIGLTIATQWRMPAAITKKLKSLWSPMANIAGRLRGNNSYASTLLMGILWGWLPCGLTYAMLLAAAASADAVQGGLVMLCFGLGTLPAMLLIGISAARVRGWLNARGIQQTIGALVIVFGTWTAAVAALPQHQSHALGTCEDGPEECQTGHSHHGDQ